MLGLIITCAVLSIINNEAMVEKEDGGSEDDLEKKITWILNALMVVGGLIYIFLNSFLLSSWVKQLKNYILMASAVNCVNTPRTRLVS